MFIAPGAAQRAGDSITKIKITFERSEASLSEFLRFRGEPVASRLAF
jgi:hypothetical protein